MTTTKHSYARDSSKSSRMLLFAIVLIAAMETAYIGYTSSVRNQNSDFNTRTLSVKKKPVMPIKELSIIGERNSGTSWTVDHLTECFSHSLNVIDQLVRHKHWFQHDVPNGRERVGTAVVAIFRDPYFWVEAMRDVPHHSPAHYNMDWEQFVTTPWTMPRSSSDFDQRKKDASAENVMCQLYFNYDQIIPCLKPTGFFNKSYGLSFEAPRYELQNDGSGQSYASIIDLRSDKIKNHLSVANWDWVQDFFPVRYEDLLSTGTDFLIQHIEAVTGVKSKCNPYPPLNRESRPLSESYIRWMTKYVDWDVEALVGYAPWTAATEPR